MATVVSIGRNIGARPMSADQWDQFRALTFATVADAVGPVVFDGTGEGTYGEQVEESYTVIGAGEPRNTRAGRPFLTRLGVLAREFGQDAIAVTAAETSFIGADGSNRIASDL